MRKVVSSFGLIIISILLFLAGACSSKATDTEWTIPADFDTYIDENKTFSISYPSDWEVDISRLPEKRILKEELLESIDDQLDLGQSFTVFFVGVPCGIACYHPSCNMVIEPLGDIKSLREYNASATMYMKLLVDDYQEISRETTIIDGRESIIMEYKATFETGETPMPMHALDLTTLKGDTSWGVTCALITDFADYAEYEEDFHNVVRSLQLH